MTHAMESESRVSPKRNPELDRRLRAGERLQIFEELRRGAWELKEKHRDYRLVLIIANTAFETCLQ